MTAGRTESLPVVPHLQMQPVSIDAQGHVDLGARGVAHDVVDGFLEREEASRLTSASRSWAVSSRCWARWSVVPALPRAHAGNEESPGQAVGYTVVVVIIAIVAGFIATSITSTLFGIGPAMQISY
jgi:hypothetical protein